MNKLLLNFALLPSGLWKSFGADVDQLRALLEVKLKLDDRRPVNFGRPKEAKKDRRYSILISMVISFFTGLLYIMPLILFRGRLLALTGYFTFFLFLLTFSLIVDFSNILIDTRDRYIVLPRPVNDRTLFLSRLLHIFVYLFRIVVPMSLPGWITVGIVAGWTAVLWFPVAVLLLVLTSVFLVMGAYLAMLRLAPPERFKDILSYFQIGMSVIVFAMAYLGPRAMNSEQLTTLQLKDFPWIYYLPSFWIASTWSWIHFHAVPAGTIYYSLLAVAVPLTALWITVKFFAPQFTARLGGLDAAEPAAAGKSPRAVSGERLYQRAAVLLNRRAEAEAGFLLAWLQTARSRSFKMKIYPMFAYVPIYFVYLMLQQRQPLREVWTQLPGTRTYLVLLYMSAVVMLQAISLVTTSEQYKAAWIYYAAPVQEPGAIMAGAFKAMWVKYFLPFFLVISAFVLVVWGVKTLPDLLLAMTNVTLFAIALIRIGNRRLPFSQLDQVNASGSRALRTFLSMAVLGTLGVGHYFAVRLDMLWLKGLFFALSGGLLWLIWDSYAHTRWTDMKAAEL